MCKKDWNLGCINNAIASVLVGATILGIIISASGVSFKHQIAPKLQNVKIELEADSTFIISYDDKMDIIDGLESIMQNHERLLENKYQYMIEKRAFEDSLLGKGATLISIILAILAFFGFKNFQSIEQEAKAAKEAAKEAAEAAAEAAAEETKGKINKIASGYLSANIGSEVDKAFKNHQVNTIDGIVNETLKNYDIKTKEIDEKIKEIEKSINNLRSNLSHDLESEHNDPEGTTQINATPTKEPKNKFLKKDK